MTNKQTLFSRPTVRSHDFDYGQMRRSEVQVSDTKSSNIYIYIHTHRYVYIYTCISLSIYIYTYIYIYICAYIHTYILVDPNIPRPPAGRRPARPAAAPPGAPAGPGSVSEYKNMCLLINCKRITR